MPILHSYYQDVYRCPIVRLDGYSAQHGLSTGILAYLDFGGATGSSKDGLAETMLAFATERGTLQPGMPVVEASSGSFGAAPADKAANARAMAINTCFMLENQFIFLFCRQQSEKYARNCCRPSYQRQS